MRDKKKKEGEKIKKRMSKNEKSVLIPGQICGQKIP